MFQKEVIVDCRGHLYGRLASIVAKELLSGQKIVRLSARSLSFAFALCSPRRTDARSHGGNRSQWLVYVLFGEQRERGRRQREREKRKK
jgi:hypothetical protein